jgi:hypothetical protein
LYKEVNCTDPSRSVRIPWLYRRWSNFNIVHFKRFSSNFECNKTVLTTEGILLGAMTFCIITLSITTLCKMTLKLMTVSITALSTMKGSI